MLEASRVSFYRCSLLWLGLTTRRHSFYSRLYLSSQDKHVVHHLTMQLELLPSWTTLAVQTVGQPGGPVSAEFEVSNEELDW